MNIVSYVLICIIRLYQLTLSKLITLLFGNVCRFKPSCSAYTMTCIKNHGALKGMAYGTVRICKCNPFFKGGMDEPPPKTIGT
jgi:putative membrane protein insertion efficiency factor